MIKAIVLSSFCLFSSAAFAINAHPFMNTSNTKSLYLSGDLAFMYSREEKLAYVQNIRTLHIEATKEIPELAEQYSTNRVVLPDQSIAFNGNRRLNTRTLEVTDYPLNSFFAQVLKYKEGTYLALNYDTYCVFDLKKGCPREQEKKFKKRRHVEDIYLLKEDQNKYVFVAWSLGRVSIATLDKKTLEWSESIHGQIPFRTPYRTALITPTDDHTLFFALLAERNDRDQKKSAIAKWDLSMGTLQAKEIDRYLDTVDLVVPNGRSVDLMAKNLNCFGECAYHRSANLTVNLQDLSITEGPKERFGIVLEGPVQRYVNTSEISEYLQVSDASFLKLGTGIHQKRNYNEWYQPGKGFSLVEPAADFKDLCAKSDAIQLAARQSLPRRPCYDIDVKELASFTSLSLKSTYPLSLKLVPGDFEGFSDLQWLSLHGADLEVATTGLFRGLSAVESIDLSYSALKKIETDAFAGLPKLRTLKLGGPVSGHSELELAPGSLHGLSSLGEVIISNSKITGSAASFEGTPVLENVTFFESDLRKVPDDFFASLKTKSLVIENGTLTNFKPITFAGHSELESLDFFALGLSSLPDGIFKDLKNLKLLNLHTNKLTALSDENLEDLKGLSELRLYQNPISEKELRKIRERLPDTTVLF